MKDNYISGLKFLSQSKIATINALSYFRRCLYDDARNSAAWYQLGRCLEELGRTHKALRAYRACRRFSGLNKEYSDYEKIIDHAIRRLEVEIEISYLKSGYTHLVHAAQKNSLVLFQKFLSSGEDINESDKYGGTPLCTAASHGHLEIVKCAIEAKADINGRDSIGRTPLVLACGGNHLEVASHLLRHGAAIHLKDREKHTALWAAIFSAGSASLCKLLLEHGASPQEKYDNDQTPLLLACAYSRTAIIKLLLKSDVDIHEKNGQGNSPLALAVTAKNVKLVEKLLQMDADVNTSNNYNHSPLMDAVSENHLAMVELLINHGAYIDAKSDYAETPLENSQKMLNKGTRHADYATANKIAEVLKKGKRRNGSTGI